MAMAPTILQCLCVPPCALISECQHSQTIAGLSETYSKLESSSSSTTHSEAAGIPVGHCHHFPDQYTPLAADISLPSPTRSPSSISNILITEHPEPVNKCATATATELQQIQAQEEYMIEKYHSVFELLESRYRQLGEELKWETENVFEEQVVRAVMKVVRECMGMNEVVLEEGRKRLWEGFEGEDGEENREDGEDWEGKTDVEIMAGWVEEKSDGSSDGEEENGFENVMGGLREWEEVELEMI